MNETSAVIRSPVSEPNFGRLRLYDAGMGLLHALQGVAILVLSNDFALPVTAALMEGRLRVRDLHVAVRVLQLVRAQPGRPVARLLVGERVYVALSPVAKSALAWQAFANTLVPS